MKPVVYCLIAAVLYGASYVFSKNALTKVDFWTAALVSDVIMFFGSIVVYAMALRFFGASFNPSQLISLGSVNAALAGLCWAVGGFVWYLALQKGDLWYVSIMVLFTEASIPVIFGMAAMKERVSPRDLIGIGLLVGGTVLLAQKR
jgi:uncharacterized membrane protein